MTFTPKNIHIVCIEKNHYKQSEIYESDVDVTHAASHVDIAILDINYMCRMR